VLFTLRAWTDAFKTFDWEIAMPVPELAMKQIGQLLLLSEANQYRYVLLKISDPGCAV
jgi:hypothetical protein